jgi:Fic family protein
VKAESDEDIAKVLKGSLESTCKGLAVFADSLKTSGFEEAIPKYRQLEAVLVQQRLWCKNRKRAELDPFWQEIARKAEQIHKVMSPLAEVMKNLKSVDSLTQKEEKTSLQAKILETLAKPKFTSLHSLSKLLGCEKNALTTEIRNLVQKGVVEKRGWGNGISYRLGTSGQLGKRL